MKNGVFSVRGSSSSTVLCLCGKISDKELPELSRYIETCLDAGGISNIYIDLSDVKLLTPETLAFLIEQNDRFRAFSTKLWIQSPNPKITTMLDLNGNGRFLNMTRSL